MLRRSAISGAVNVENAASFEASAESSCIAAAARLIAAPSAANIASQAWSIKAMEASLRAHGKQGMYAVGVEAPVQTCGLSCVVQRLCQRSNVSTRQEQWDHFSGDECLNWFAVDAEACHGCSLAEILQQWNLCCQFQNNGSDNKVAGNMRLTERSQVEKVPIFFLFHSSSGVLFTLSATSDTLKLFCKYFGVFQVLAAKYLHYG